MELRLDPRTCRWLRPGRRETASEHQGHLLDVELPLQLPRFRMLEVEEVVRAWAGVYRQIPLKTEGLLTGEAVIPRVVPGHTHERRCRMQRHRHPYPIVRGLLYGWLA